MLLFIGSDIHGDIQAAKKMVKAFHQTQASYLICLGDILNHGPRNPLPEHYDPQAVAKLLNSIHHQILAIRGNCDSEVDQALCHFPMLTDYQQLLTKQRRIFLTHGHLYRPDNLPPLQPGDLFVSGHTHLPVAECGDDQIYRLNPGSVAIPRGEWPASYALLSPHQMKVLDLNTSESLLECNLDS